MSNQSDQIEVFVKMSAVLNGFAPEMFAPSVDPADLKTVYFKFIIGKAPERFHELLHAFSEMVAGGVSPQDIGAMLNGTAGGLPEPMVNLALSINKLWYLGSWYDPEAPDDPTKQQVVSDQAYIRGLSWQVMQSHAMGNSPFTFGYWAKDPAASLALTTGNPAATGRGTS